ncbi:hypothetical protein ALQ09_00476 [Pseudomonas viridiflava]|nr:hypothetical protein ALQ09_00476 [Pseudomonas viridiflava]
MYAIEVVMISDIKTYMLNLKVVLAMLGARHFLAEGFSGYTNFYRCKAQCSVHII